VPFNSESLVTGKLFEDIREAVHAQADPDKYDAIVVINLCVPTASGVPLQLLPKEINGVRIIGIDVPGFGIPTHAEAKDVLAGAMLRYARSRGRSRPGGGAAHRGQATSPPSRCWARCSRPTRWHRHDARTPMGLAAGPVVPTREWRELYAALDCSVVAAIHPFYTASVREFQAAGRPVVVARRRWATTAPRPGCRPSAPPAACRRRRSTPPRTNGCRPSAARWRRRRSRAASRCQRLRRQRTAGGRLLIESGADLPYVGTACPRTPWSDADREWLQARGVHVQYRASLEQDLAAVREFRPTWPSAPRPWCRRPSRPRSRRCTSPT
jgi:chlorophyllide a reductase subunit Y